MSETMFNCSKQFIGEIQIICCTILFGLSFVGQRYAMVDGTIGPITYNAARYAMSTVILIALRPILDYYSLKTMIELERRNSELAASEGSHRSKALEIDHTLKPVEASIWSSFFSSLPFFIGLGGMGNFCGSMLQQIGLVTVSAGKVGFITGSYVVLVPFAEYFLPWFQQGKLSFRIWMGAFLCFGGLYFISGCQDSESCFGSAVGRGEILIVISVFFWVITILTGDVASKRYDCLTLTLGEFVLVTILTSICAIYMEPEIVANLGTILRQNWPSIVFVGITEAGGYLLSNIGQMHVPPSRAAILFSGGEGVSACVCGYLFLSEYLTPLEIFGCFLMIAAALLSSTALADEEDGEDSAHGDDEDDDFSLETDIHTIPENVRNSLGGGSQSGGDSSRRGSYSIEYSLLHNEIGEGLQSNGRRDSSSSTQRRFSGESNGKVGSQGHTNSYLQSTRPQPSYGAVSSTSPDKLTTLHDLM